MDKSSIFKVINGLTSALLIAPIISTATMAMAQETNDDSVEEDNIRVVYENDFNSENYPDDVVKPAGDAELEWFDDVEINGETETGVWVRNRTNDYDSLEIPFDAIGIEEGHNYTIQVSGYISDDQILEDDLSMNIETEEGYYWIDDLSEISAGEVFELEGTYTAYQRDGERAFRIKTNNSTEMEFAVTNILITTEDTLEEDSEDDENTEDSTGPGEEDSDEESEDEENDDEPEEDPELEVLYHEIFTESLGQITQAGNATLTHLPNFTVGDQTGAVHITNRVNNHDGIDISFDDIGLERGYTYNVTVHGFVDEVEEPEDGDQAVIQIPSGDYPVVGSTDFIPGQEFVIEDSHDWVDATDEAFRIQSSWVDGGRENEISFYVTEIIIEKAGEVEVEVPDPDAPPAEEFTFIDFENQELNGIVERNGEEILEITDAENHTEGGEYSLHVSNRQGDWHGPSLEVTPYINLGETYEVSAWVKVDTDSNQTITLSTQVGDGSSAAYNNISSATLSSEDGWVEIRGEYRYTSLGGGFVSIYLESNNVNLEFYVDDIDFQQIESDPIDVDLTLPSVQEVYANHFRIGNAVSMPDLEGPRLDLLKHHHSLVTAENAMKPGEVYDGREFDFSGSDALAERVEAENLDLHGHVLVWHSQSPDWHHTGENGSLTRAEALENMQTHIRTVMEHFGDLGSWDVVNEALDGNWENPSDWKSNLRNTGWYRAIGDDYIYEAFKYARQVADENGWHDMVLYYNDYNDHVQPKAQTMYYMIKDINEQYAEETGTDRNLISGVGMQGHYSININPETVKESIERFEQLDIEIGITELDVTTNTENQYVEEEWIRQGQIYARLFQIFREHSDSIDRVTFWGLNDANSWRSERYPLLFDGSLRAKPSYDAVIDPDAFLEEYPVGEASVKEGFAVYGTPEMDGEIDDVWNEAHVLNMNQMQQAHEILADGTGRVLWDEQNLYVLFQVSDSILDISAEEAHEQDSVEAFVNETGETTTSYIDGVGQYRVNYENESSFNPSSYSEGFDSDTVVSDSGYIVEMAIPWKNVTPEAWQTIGFDIQINDARDGARHGVAAWNDDTGMGWSDPSVFGRITLATTIEELVILLEERISNLEEAIDENEENLAELTSQLSELQNLLNVLQDELGEANETISELEDRVRELEERLAQLEAGDEEEPGDGDEEPTDPEEIIEVEDGTPTPILPEQTVVLPDGDTSIEMPADLPEGTEIIVEYLDEADLPELNVEGDYTLVIAGELVRVTMVYAEGEEEYEGNFVLTLGITDDYVGEEVFIYYFNEETGLWEQRVAEIDGDTITATVTHFSIYGVFAQVEDEEPVDIEELIRELEERIADLEEALNENEGNIEELTSQLTALQNLLIALRDELGETNETVTNLENRVSELEDRVAELETSDEEEPSDDGEDVTEDDSSTGTGVGDDSDSSGQNGSTDGEVDSEQTLPKTATATWTVGLIGLMGLVTGSGIHFIRKRK